MAYGDLKQFFCAQPFTTLVAAQRNYLLCCPAWGGHPVAPIEASPEEVWNSDKAQEFRASILDGSFRLCQRCPVLEEWVARAAGGEPNLGSKKRAMRKSSFLRSVIENGSTELSRVPKRIVLSQSNTCNLKCPSCRTRLIQTKNEPTSDVDTAKHFLSGTALEGQVQVIRAAGAGEVFAIPKYRDFLLGLRREENPDLRLSLVTNGTLLRRYLPAILEVGPPVNNITISVDAGTNETYEAVRLGSTWAKIMANLRYVASTHITTVLVMVVQQKNWPEMGSLLELAKLLHFAEVHYAGIHRVAGSVTANDQTLPRNAVHWPAHPQHAAFVKYLCGFYERYRDHVEFQQSPRVTLSNLANLARGQDPPWLAVDESSSDHIAGHPKWRP